MSRLSYDSANRWQQQQRSTLVGTAALTSYGKNTFVSRSIITSHPIKPTSRTIQAAVLTALYHARRLSVWIAPLVRDCGCAVGAKGVALVGYPGGRYGLSF
jgi:hypothetical protein